MICRFCHKGIALVTTGWIHMENGFFGLHRCTIENKRPDYIKNINVATPVSRKEKLKRILKYD